MRHEFHAPLPMRPSPRSPPLPPLVPLPLSYSHDPVRQPLRIIIRISAINRLKARVSGIEETDEIGNELGAAEGEEEGAGGEDDGEEEVDLGVTELVLEGLELG